MLTPLQVLGLFLLLLFVVIGIIGLLLHEANARKAQRRSNAINAKLDDIASGEDLDAETKLRRTFRHLTLEEEQKLETARSRGSRVVSAHAEYERRHGEWSDTEDATKAAWLIDALDVYVQALKEASDYCSFKNANRVRRKWQSARQALSTSSRNAYVRLCALAPYDKAAFHGLWDLILLAEQVYDCPPQVRRYPADWNAWLNRHVLDPQVDDYHPPLVVPRRRGALRLRAIRAFDRRDVPAAKEILALCNAYDDCYAEVGEQLVNDLTRIISPSVHAGQ